MIKKKCKDLRSFSESFDIDFKGQVYLNLDNAIRQKKICSSY